MQPQLWAAVSAVVGVASTLVVFSLSGMMGDPTSWCPGYFASCFPFKPRDLWRL